MQQRPYISDGLRACREGRGEPKREEVEKWREVQYTNLPTCIFISYGGQESISQTCHWIYHQRGCVGGSKGERRRSAIVYQHLYHIVLLPSTRVVRTTNAVVGSRVATGFQDLKQNVYPNHSRSESGLHKRCSHVKCCS